MDIFCERANKVLSIWYLNLDCRQTSFEIVSTARCPAEDFDPPPAGMDRNPALLGRISDFNEICQLKL